MRRPDWVPAGSPLHALDRCGRARDELMCERADSVWRSGKQVTVQGVVRQWIAESRVRIE